MMTNIILIISLIIKSKIMATIVIATTIIK